MTAASFDEAIAHTPLGDGRYRASTPPSWMASGRVPAGLVEAQLMAGLAATVTDPQYRPLSFTAHLLRAPGEGDYEVQTDVLRTGRTLVSTAARVVQDDKLIATALASFATDRPSPEFDELPMPEVAPPTPGRENDGYVPEFAFPYGDNVVMQDRLGPKPFTAPDGPMERVGWAGFAQARPIDAPGLLMIGDIGMMGWWVRLDRMYTTATLDHTTYFRADLSQAKADDMVLLRSRTGLVRGGYLDWDLDIWAPDGALLCQSRQILAILG
ncbi:acyl-CoA thioesterase [Candidatus Poriferisocius sp.]|uniref:acyl-CoA thioesterase n=1 Tax=Candidatus Poriferisocius sp. TaxID=3101276 RepID=UPI003B01EC13